MRRLAAVLFIATACRPGPTPLRLGTTYTVQQSGALAVLESLWTGPPPFTTVVAPSGQILRAAANSDLDVVITHAPALEQRLLVGPGHALLRCPLAASRFAVVGPAAAPAAVGGAARGCRARRRRRAGVPPHRRSGRAVCLARRLVRHTREGARVVARRGSDAGSALVPGVGRGPGGDTPPRRRAAGLRARRSPHVREARQAGVPHPVRRR